MLNPLIRRIYFFKTGPLTGSTAPGGNKSVFVAKSPLTNIWENALVSGACGVELKRAGYDGIIIQGKAEKPVYLWMFDGGAELKDANKLRGMDTFEICGVIKQDLGIQRVSELLLQDPLMRALSG